MSTVRDSFPFILTTIFIDSLSAAIAFPVLPLIVRDLRGGSLSDGAFELGLLTSIYSFAMFLASPALGVLSDAFGRRAILLPAMFGMVLFFTVCAVSSQLWLLFVARFAAGICGGSMTIAIAYVADSTIPAERAKAFGRVMAVASAGAIVGPLLGTFLIRWGPRSPFSAAAILIILNLVYGYLRLPESLPVQSRRPFSFLRMNPFRMMSHLIGDKDLFKLGMVVFCIHMGTMISACMWFVFLQVRLKWTPIQIGTWLTLMALLNVLVQGTLTQRFIRLFGERNTFRQCMIWGAVTYVLYGFVDKGWQMYAVLLISAPSWIVIPLSRSIPSRGVSSQHQGELQGTLTTISSVAAIIGPPLAGFLFSHFSEPSSLAFLPGIVFWAAALFVFCGLAVEFAR